MSKCSYTYIHVHILMFVLQLIIIMYKYSLHRAYLSKHGKIRQKPQICQAGTVFDL